MENVRTEQFLGNTKVIVGNKYSDLVLETLGKVYIKTGNNSRVLSDVLKLLDQINENKIRSSTIIVDNTLQMEEMEYPGDGYFIYNKLNTTLYISYDNRYIALIEASEGAKEGYVRRSGDTMTGPLEIITSTAPLIVASSKLIKNLNSEFVGGYSQSEIAKKYVNEYIFGNWTFKGQGISENNWTFKNNIRVYGDLVTSGSISTPEFASGFGGYGWRLDADTNTLTIDYLVVRKAMKVYEMVINKISATNGSLWISNSSKCSSAISPIILTEEQLNSTIIEGVLNKDLLLKLLRTDTYYLLTVNSNIENTITLTSELSKPSSINTTPKTFLDFKFIIHIINPIDLISSPLFKGIETLYDENLLTSEWSTYEGDATEEEYLAFKRTIALYYISKEKVVTKWGGNEGQWDEGTIPLEWEYMPTFDKNYTFYIIPKTQDASNDFEQKGSNSEYLVGIKTFYKYFGTNQDLVNTAISESNSQYNLGGIPDITLNNIWIIDTDKNEYPTFKPGDIIRCQKYSDGNIKYYDAIILSQIGVRTFIISKAASVFDIYTEISYNEDGSINYTKEEYNSQLYNRTESSYNINTGTVQPNGESANTNQQADPDNSEEKSLSRLDNPMVGDDLVQVGNIIETQRQNAIYLTSCDEGSPFIDIISGLNRPDYSVLYDIPLYRRESFIYKKENSTFKYNGVKYDYYIQKELPEIEYIEGIQIEGESYYGTLYPTRNSIIQQDSGVYKHAYTKTTKVRLGNLDGIYNEVFKTKQPYGFGLYGENVFLTGEFYLSNGQSVVEFTKDQIRLEILGTSSKNFVLLSEGPFTNSIQLFLKKPISANTKISCHWKLISGQNPNVYLNKIDFPNQKQLVTSEFITTNDTYDGLSVEFISSGEISNIMLSLGDKKYDWEPAELDSIGSTFIMTENGISLMGKEILLKGKIKFEYLDGLTQDNLNYLTQNLRDATKESTQILGGLILSNTLALGKTETIEGSEEDEKKFTIYSGLSGNYDESQVGNGISYWSGGDAFDRDSMPPELYPEGIRPASSLIRMDGSGYLANGNIEWDVDGNLHVNPLTFWIDIVGGESETLEKLLNKLVNLFSPVYEDPQNDQSPIVGIYAKYPLAVQGGITQYTGVPLTLPSIFEGLPIDGDTIYWELDSSGNKAVLKAKGGSGGGGGEFDIKQVWAALAGETNEQINKSHLTTALAGYATTEQLNTKWTQDNSKISNWDTAFGWGDHKKAGYAHLAGEETFTGLKHFTAGLSVGAGKHKLYEKDGVVYFDGDLAVTGGITQYATDGVSVSTIMDGVVTDNVTIKKENGKLIVIGGSGSSFDKTAMWAALAANTTEPIHKSHLTTALQGYATESWANSNFLGKTDKAVDSDKVDGIHANGFCRAYSASYSFGDNQNLITTAQFVEKLKSLGAFNQPYWMCKGSWYYAGNQIISDSGYGNIQLAGAVVEFMGHEGAYTIRITTAPTTTNGVRNSIFIYQNHGESYEPRWIKVASTFDNVYSADKLSVYNSNNVNNPNWDEYKATIENFGGNATGIPPVGDNANSVLNIPMSKHGTNKMYGFQMAFCSQNEEIFARAWKSGNIGSWYGIPMVVSGRLKKGFSSVECTDWFRSIGNSGWVNDSWGGGWYMQDSNWIRAFNDKSVYTNGTMQARKLVTTSSGIDITYGNNNEFIRVGYNESDGDFVTFKVPGNNNQSKWMKLSSSKGLYISGILETTWDIYGRSFEANYGSNSGELNTNLSSFYDKATPAIPHDGYRYLLGWQDNCPQGYTTGYAIGSYRVNVNWGSMIFEVCNYEGSRSRLTQMELRGKDNTLWLSGNILAIGGITQYSDKRAKTIIEQITLSLKDIANSPAVRFKWNGWKQQDDGKTHIGGIAQYIQNILPEVIYNSDDVLTMDYATTGYIFAVNTAKHLLNFETKTDREINRLKKRIKQLEKQLKKLGYEEANIMDN